MAIFEQQIDSALQALGAPVKDQFDRFCQQAVTRLQQLSDMGKAGDLPMLTLPARKDDLKNMEAQAERIRTQSRRLLVLGTGGSSLGGQTMVALKKHAFAPDLPCDVQFVDNTDPFTLDALLNTYDPLKDIVLVVSKSGSTVETLVQFLVLLDHAKKHRAVLEKSFLVITIPGENPLRKLATENNIPVIDHDPKLGGRFSVFSEVGLLPAAVAGLDIAALRNGAQKLWEETLKQKEKSAVAQGAALQAVAMQMGRSVSVLMPYADRLTHLSAWFAQLWAESLGKGGKGSTALRAVGAIDQHSQLQLFLDGPRDKLITMILLENIGKGPKIPSTEDSTLAYLKNHDAGDVIDAQQRATVDTLTRHGVPVRTLHAKSLEEETLGALLMHFMLEIVLVADLIGVNAFDQPAVEESKVLARKYLGE